MKFLFLILFLFLAGCSGEKRNSLKVAATSVPHAEILEAAIPLLKEEGIQLEVVVVEDYNTPNRALQDGEVDANFFQHIPFLEQQSKDFGYRIISLVPIHLEPMGLYSNKITDLKSLRPGSRIALPADPSNQARALAMLAELDLIQLSKKGQEASVLSISENPHSYQFLEIDSALLVRSLEDVEVAAITTNFALQSGLSPSKDAIVQESGQSDYVNIVAVKEGDQDKPAILALKQAMTSKKIKLYIESHYKDAIIPIF